MNGLPVWWYYCLECDLLMSVSPHHPVVAEKAFAFDMDGVLVDTLESLYQAYSGFLSELGVTGTRAEFDSLNGPNLHEIVARLRHTHGLSPSPEALIARYRLQLARVYDDARLVEGAREALSAARSRGYRLALVSSAPRRAIEKVLTRHGLGFDVVVSGEDVAEAKPSPAIYQKARATLLGDLYAVEDSAHGIASAHAAGFKVIGFKHQHPDARFTADSMVEVRQVIEGCRVFAGPVTLERVEHSLDAEAMGKVDRVWAARPRRDRSHDSQHPALFDGPMLAYLDHTAGEDGVRVRCFLSSYRFFYAGAIAPLSVSGITVDPSGRFLTGVRGAVSEYPGRTELVPSGSLENTDHVQQLTQELAEEAGIASNEVQAIETLGLLHDVDHDVYDIACRITVSTFSRLANNTEYHHLRVTEHLDEADSIPTSVALARLAQIGHGGSRQ